MSAILNNRRIIYFLIFQNENYLHNSKDISVVHVVPEYM